MIIIMYIDELDAQSLITEKENLKKEKYFEYFLDDISMRVVYVGDEILNINIDIDSINNMWILKDIFGTEVPLSTKDQVLLVFSHLGVKSDDKSEEKHCIKSVTISGKKYDNNCEGSITEIDIALAKKATKIKNHPSVYGVSAGGGELLTILDLFEPIGADKENFKYLLMKLKAILNEPNKYISNLF